MEITNRLLDLANRLLDLANRLLDLAVHGSIRTRLAAKAWFGRLLTRDVCTHLNQDGKLWTTMQTDWLSVLLKVCFLLQCTIRWFPIRAGLYLSIHLSIHLSIQPTNHPFIHPSVHLSIHPFNQQPIQLSFHPSIYPSIMLYAY